MIRIISAIVFGLVVAATGVATAQDAKDPRDVKDVAMERKVRNLGLRIGNAYACTDAKAHGEFKEEAHYLFDLIVQDMGSDLGYAYATAMGIGSAQPKEKLDCTARLKDWEEVREDYQLKENK